MLAHCAIEPAINYHRNGHGLRVPDNARPALQSRLYFENNGSDANICGGRPSY